MRISLITTCFNRENTIKYSIESILKQIFIDIEYIIIDGSSTDNTFNIIKSFGNRISKVVSEPDHGMYEAINKGIKLATGDVIGLVHSDDMLYSSETISHIEKCFEDTGADLVYGDGLFVDYNDTTKVVRNWISGKYSKTKMKFGWLPLHPTVYIKRECIEKLGLYDDSYKIAADSDFLIRYLYENNLKVHYLNEYIIKMRMGGLSTDRKKMKQKWDEDLRLYRNHGFLPHFTLACKIVSKVPQFISAKFIK